MSLLTWFVRCPAHFQMLISSAVVWQAQGLVVSVASLCCSPGTVLGAWRSHISVLLVFAPSLSVMPEATTARSLAFLVAWSIGCGRNRRVFIAEVKIPSGIVEENQDIARRWTAAGARRLVFLVDRPPSE